MRRTILAAPLAALLLALAARAGDAPAAKLEFAEKEFLYEPVMVGDKVSHVFKFKNTGNADLIIRRVDPSCGCTVGKFPHEPIKPGGEGSVELTLDTTEKNAGPCYVSATVYSNDASQAVLGPCTQRLELKGEVQSCYKLMPMGAYYGPVLRGREPIFRKISAPGTRDAEQGYDITSIDIPTDWIKVEKRPLQAPELQGAKSGWMLEVSILPHVPAGDFHEVVVVHTDNKKQPLFRFPVVGMASGPIRTSESVFFSMIRRGAEPERVIPMERIDNARGLPILGVEFDKARFVVTSETVVEGVRTDLRVKVRADAPPGPFMSYIEVRLDLSEQPLVKIPTFGDIQPRVQVDPPLLLLHAGDKEARFTVSVAKGKKLAVKSDAFNATVEQASTSLVRLVAKKPVEKGEKLEVLLETDVPGEETVRVPVEVR